MGSLSLDFTTVWSNATDIINSMWPVFAIPLGVIFGFGLMSKIIKEIKHAIGGV